MSPARPGPGPAVSGTCLLENLNMSVFRLLSSDSGKDARPLTNIQENELRRRSVRLFICSPAQRASTNSMSKYV
jgi:hypothetical protein